MTTINAVNTALNGQSGTGKFAGTDSPTLVTPVLGDATANSLTFSPTTNGIVGTTTNNNAASGIVGEILFSQILNASATGLVDNVTKNITSVILTAGDWDVWGNVTFTASVAAAQVACATNTVSATLPDISLIDSIVPSSPTISIAGVSAPYRRYSVAGSTTVFLLANAIFVSGTVVASGSITARRAR